MDKHLRIAGLTAIFVAFIIGVALIEQNNTSVFFGQYFAVAVPISLTIGALVFMVLRIIHSCKCGENPDYWRCWNCGEQNHNDFFDCWKCHKPKQKPSFKGDFE